MTTGPTDGTVTTAAGGPDGMPLALKLNEGLGLAGGGGYLGRFISGAQRWVTNWLAKDLSLPRLPATRLDDWIGVGGGWGLTLLIAGLCVAGQWLLILLQIFCRPCIRTMFETLSL